jgi:two-component system KDP operon response regulator KdpE
MTCSVLVVEDDPPIRKGMVALLRIHGHHADAVATVAEALSHVEASLPTHVLLDLNLPDAPGTDVLRRIRADALPIRVALLTGASDAALIDEARALSVEAVFIKPPNWGKLLDWIAVS